MLEKIAAGVLGSAVSGIMGSLFGGTKKTDTADDGGIFQALLGKTASAGTTGGDGLSASTTSDKVSSDTQDAIDFLHDMTDGGLAGYWKHMIKQMREKAMAGLGVTEDSLAKMPPEQKDALEAKIEEIVKQQMAKAMGVSPDDAAKMITQIDKVNGVQAANQVEANKAYKNTPEIV